MSLAGTRQTLVQCDFDGTITEEDVSFKLLDAFANGDWRRIFRQHQKGRITVGRFNTEAFAMVRADRQSLLAVARAQIKIRPGFPELVTFCHREGFRLVIVSNGLDFYIKAILQDLGMGDIEAFAAATQFYPEGLRVEYVGPDGRHLDENFKEAYVDFFLKADYRVIYTGNGDSDFQPARKCHYVFATGNLLARCQRANLDCTPFTDFNEVVSVLERL